MILKLLLCSLIVSSVLSDDIANHNITFLHNGKSFDKLNKVAFDALSTSLSIGNVNPITVGYSVATKTTTRPIIGNLIGLTTSFSNDENGSFLTITVPSISITGNLEFTTTRGSASLFKETIPTTLTVAGQLEIKARVNPIFGESPTLEFLTANLGTDETPVTVTLSDSGYWLSAVKTIVTDNILDNLQSSLNDAAKIVVEEKLSNELRRGAFGINDFLSLDLNLADELIHVSQSGIALNPKGVVYSPIKHEAATSTQTATFTLEEGQTGINVTTPVLNSAFNSFFKPESDQIISGDTGAKIFKLGNFKTALTFDENYDDNMEVFAKINILKSKTTIDENIQFYVTYDLDLSLVIKNFLDKTEKTILTKTKWYAVVEGNVTINEKTNKVAVKINDNLSSLSTDLKFNEQGVLDVDNLVNAMQPILETLYGTFSKEEVPVEIPFSHLLSYGKATATVSTTKDGFNIILAKKEPESAME